MRKGVTVLLVLAMLLFVASLVFAGNVAAPVQENRRLTGEEPVSGARYVPSVPGLICSPGDTVGMTQYDYQTNGSTGDRLMVDAAGGKHFNWMEGIDYVGGVRQVDFNYADAAGVWLGVQVVSQANGAGYTQISSTTDGRAAISYHDSNSGNYIVYAEDQVQGFGIFNYFDPPDMLTLRYYWPYIAVDRNDNIHIVCQENTGVAGQEQAFAYTRSVDGGSSWSRLTIVDTLMDISNIVVASPVSDKVALVYTHPLDYETQVMNDIYYVESLDGVTWDFDDGKVNVTGYGSPDSAFAYTDLDAIYDYNDDLNIIWNAQWVTDAGVYFHTFLYHYNQGLDEINMITETDPAIDTLWDTGYCQVSSTPSMPFGAWNRPLAKMSLGVYHDGDVDGLFALWTQMDPSDCSLAGWANGELYYSYSINFSDWTEPVDITNSNSNGCQAGECESDHWSSLADRVDDSLHVIYINDKDPGGVPQDEGSVTDNPVLYLSVPNPLLTGIDDRESVPNTFALSQNYPNPFNARTNINFELLEKSEVELSVYDITGAKVVTLADGEMEAGSHSINWDASGVASGVYYYSLKANGEQSSRKMTLLK